MENRKQNKDNKVKEERTNADRSDVDWAARKSTPKLPTCDDGGGAGDGWPSFSGSQITDIQLCTRESMHFRLSPQQSPPLCT
uniref:Uncharacterized protein n=1 Tax=Romanomermis culicivorax TaxID=13658 RepID=A0A915JDU0_ROMCU